MSIKNGVFYFLEKVTTLFKSIGSFVIYLISPRIVIGRVIYRTEHAYTFEGTLNKNVIEKNSRDSIPRSKKYYIGRKGGVRWVVLI